MRALSRFLFVIFLFGIVCQRAHASKKEVQPDACGAADANFKITSAPSAALSAPPDGKAQIVFIETFIHEGGPFMGKHTFETRFGIDGQWAGATQNNSYFAVNVAPGEHHLCTAPQGGYGSIKEKFGVTSLKVEAGKTYYVELKIQATVVYKAMSEAASLTKLEEDEGQFRVKSHQLTASTPVSKNTSSQ